MPITSSQTTLAMTVYGLLSRGGLEYKESLLKTGYLTQLTQEALEVVVDKEHNKRLIHELAIHGLLDKLEESLVNQSNIHLEDGNGQTPISHAIRYQATSQIPKHLLTKANLSKKIKGTSLLQVATWAGELDKIPLENIDKESLTLKDPDNETPLGSVMEMVDYISKSHGYHHYYSSPRIKENYKILLPKLLKKLDIPELKAYKKLATKEGLIESLSLLNKELNRQTLKAISTRNNFEIDI